MGVLPPEGEWAIVGGTGELALARGTIKHKVAATTPTTNSRQLDIHALYANNSVNCKLFSAFYFITRSVVARQPLVF